MGPNLPDTVIKQLCSHKKAKFRNQYTGTLCKSWVLWYSTFRPAAFKSTIRLNLQVQKGYCNHKCTFKFNIGRQRKKIFIRLKHSYHKYSKWPPVSTLCMASPVHDLWSHVLYCPAEGIRSFIVVDGLLTQPKVWNTDRKRGRGQQRDWHVKDEQKDRTCRCTDQLS